MVGSSEGGPQTPFLQNVPHKTSLPEGICPGTVLRIRGVVPPNASRFHVNLLCGEEQGSDAVLHFNPRLDTSEVVFNSLEQGSWGREERGQGVPFQRGQPFEVLIIASDDGFKVPGAEEKRPGGRRGGTGAQPGQDEASPSRLKAVAQTRHSPPYSRFLVPEAVVGDAQYHHFRHRLPLARVRLVEVGGDVQLDSAGPGPWKANKA
ncbi:Galectin-7 [Saguinus oedipus]|uniref:Galectin n=1 Tax=Saguinus oedipus TaxID=9490 RepID=A0ABQ9TUB7_SAGOE|nr:Galectin-7 [Saguinus oedipus]